MAILLVVSFVLPYLPPTTFPTLSLLSLAVSPLILVNFLFGIYWLIRMKRQFLVSFLVLVIAYFHFNPFFLISSEGDPADYNSTLSVLSYNVRLFNAYEKNPEAENVGKQLSELLQTENPDVIAIQEYYSEHPGDFSTYPYKFIHFKGESYKLGHAIFSKYPLINRGSFDFEDSYNNTIYADVLVGSDTIRVYNLHLQSHGILPSVDFLQKNGTEGIKKRMSVKFVQQEEQVKRILYHKERSPHPTIMAGDFNNTSFSYVYRKLKKDMQDAFLQKGNGLGTTYSFDSYPMRIDFILASEKLNVVSFKTIKESFSDHYPVRTILGW